MSFVLNEEIDYFIKGGKVWYNEYGYDEVVDDRADLFIAQKAYNEAKQELQKARLLDVDYKEINASLKEIKNLR